MSDPNGSLPVQRRASFRRPGLWGLGIALTAALCLLSWWKWNRDEPERLFPLAVKAAQQENWDVARELFDQILRKAPRHAQALLYRAQVAREDGDADLALQLVRRITDDTPKEAATARYLEGSLLLEAHRARESERALLESISLNPNWLQPRERLLRLYAIQERGGGIL